MADTRIEDMKKAGWSDAEIARAVAQPQTGSQIWMNRPAGMTIEEYKVHADRIKALFTEDQIRYMSSMEGMQAFKADPCVFLVTNTPKALLPDPLVLEALVSAAVQKYLREHP